MTEVPEQSLADDVTSRTEQTLDNPFDIADLREHGLDNLMTETITYKIAVRRPSRNEFFRVLDDADYILPGCVIEHENGMDREVYWVHKKFRAELSEYTKLVLLHVCLSKRGVLFLWPARLPDENSNSAGRNWAETALRVANDAKSRWVKLRGNRDTGMYEAVAAKGVLTEPDWDKQLDGRSLEDLLKLAFPDDKVIDNLDHPVVRTLEGME